MGCCDNERAYRYKDQEKSWVHSNDSIKVSYRHHLHHHHHRHHHRQITCSEKHITEECEFPEDKCSIVAIVFLSLSIELSTKWVLSKRLLISKEHMYTAQLNLDGLKKEENGDMERHSE